ncbi:mucoidy inhibitor MuiA family protein [Pelomyxa schiedti]|nr:mucoidy inhibitor MuiA family protein [Pelomyxa schiedti]
MSGDGETDTAGKSVKSSAKSVDDSDAAATTASSQPSAVRVKDQNTLKVKYLLMNTTHVEFSKTAGEITKETAVKLPVSSRHRSKRHLQADTKSTPLFYDLIVSNVPCDATDIRVKGAAVSGQVTVVEVLEVEETSENAIARSKSLTAMRKQLAEKEQELEQMKVRETVNAEAKRNVEDTNTKFASTFLGKYPPTQSVLDQLPQMLESACSQLSQTMHAEVTLSDAKGKLNEEITKLRKAFDEAVAAKGRCIHVKLHADPGSEVLLAISATRTKIYWVPAYDLRYTSEGGYIELLYYANLFQSTGEDWKDIEVHLSTSTCDAQLSGKIPKLTQIPLSLVSKTSAPTSLPVQTTPPPEINIISEGYRIEHAISVPSTKDMSPFKVLVTSALLPCKLLYHVVPKKSPHAFLQAVAVNETGFTLLPGSCNIYFDTNFISTTNLKAIAPMEEFIALLGTDPGVRVTYSRNPPKKSAKASLAKKSITNDYIFKTFVKNAKSGPISIDVVDELPASETGEIVVSLKQPVFITNQSTVACEGGWVSRVENNNLKFRYVNVAPGVEVVSVIHYTVTWPSSLEVSGLPQY